jgi:hypothetical protein
MEMMRPFLLLIADVLVARLLPRSEPSPSWIPWEPLQHPDDSAARLTPMGIKRRSADLGRLQEKGEHASQKISLSLLHLSLRLLKWTEKRGYWE